MVAAYMETFVAEAIARAVQERRESGADEGFLEVSWEVVVYGMVCADGCGCVVGGGSGEACAADVVGFLRACLRCKQAGYEVCHYVRGVLVVRRSCRLHGVMELEDIRCTHKF